MVKERKKVKKRKSKKTDKEETLQDDKEEALHDGNNQVEHPGASEENTCEKCINEECFEHQNGHRSGLGPPQSSQDTDGFVHEDDVRIHNASQAWENDSDGWGLPDNEDKSLYNDDVVSGPQGARSAGANSDSDHSNKEDETSHKEDDTSHKEDETSDKEEIASLREHSSSSEEDT